MYIKAATVLTVSTVRYALKLKVRVRFVPSMLELDCLHSFMCGVPSFLNVIGLLEPIGIHSMKDVFVDFLK
jgi:hypothetical protein